MLTLCVHSTQSFPGNRHLQERLDCIPLDRTSVGMTTQGSPGGGQLLNTCAWSSSSSPLTSLAACADDLLLSGGQLFFLEYVQSLWLRTRQHSTAKHSLYPTDGERTLASSRSALPFSSCACSSDKRAAVVGPGIVAEQTPVQQRLAPSVDVLFWQARPK